MSSKISTFGDERPNIVRMPALLSLKRRILKFLQKDVQPSRAYDLWAENYDAEPENLMLRLDEQLFSSLLVSVNVRNQSVIDVGCGTGRHWSRLRALEPKEMIGYDVSKGMLNVLQKKFPEAKLLQIKDEQLKSIEDSSCDILITTLALAHIKNLSLAFREWNRVLKNNAEILITDYHPETLAAGGNRTFKSQGRTVSIVNYVYPVLEVQKMAEAYGFKLITFNERRIDESVRDVYIKQNAMAIYEKFKGLGIIYGMHLRRTDDNK